MTAQTTRRRAFSADPDDDIQDGSPVRSRMLCAANGCKLAGSLSEGGRTYWCAFHFRVQPQDIPRITSVLNEHAAVVDEFVTAANLLAKHPTDAASHAAHHKVAKRRLTANGYPELDTPTDKLDRWVHELHTWLGGKVIEVRTPVRRRDIA